MSHFRCRNIDPILISAHLQPFGGAIWNSGAWLRWDSMAPGFTFRINSALCGALMTCQGLPGAARGILHHPPSGTWSKRFVLGDTRRFIINSLMYHIGFIIYWLQFSSWSLIWEPPPYPPWLVQRNASGSTWVAVRFGVGENARKHERYEHSAVGPRYWDGADCGYCWYTPELTMRGTRSYVCWFIIPMNTVVVSCFIINHSYWSSKPS